MGLVGRLKFCVGTDVFDQQWHGAAYSGTLLHLAARGGHNKVLEYLTDEKCGMDVNARDQVAGKKDC
jgi:hypothetical protein